MLTVTSFTKELDYCNNYFMHLGYFYCSSKYKLCNARNAEKNNGDVFSQLHTAKYAMAKILTQKR